MELLRGDQIQSQKWCQVYQGTIDGTKEESRSAYLSKIAVLAGNFSPRLTSFDLVLAISGHYMNWV